MAAVAAALRPTDMAFLHYRDAAFQLQRAEQVPDQSAARDLMLSFACSSADPISGGRHKVLGSKPLNIPPQTSTIASHLPKAVGAAYSISCAKRHRPEHASLPDDSLIFCSFGDASVNHSTAQGAFNTAAWTSYQSVPLPLLFCCEDNGIGISTKTPAGWIAAGFQTRPGIKFDARVSLLFCIYEQFAFTVMPVQMSPRDICPRQRLRPMRPMIPCCTPCDCCQRQKHFRSMTLCTSTIRPT